LRKWPTKKKLYKAYQGFLLEHELDDTEENQKQFTDHIITEGILIAKFGDIGTPEEKEKAVKLFKEFLSKE
jgi:hypothetical protein